jgi:hypothetical protein
MFCVSLLLNEPLLFSYLKAGDDERNEVSWSKRRQLREGARLSHS